MTAHGLRSRILARDPVVGVFLLERVPLVPLRGLPVLQLDVVEPAKVEVLSLATAQAGGSGAPEQVPCLPPAALVSPHGVGCICARCCCYCYCIRGPTRSPQAGSSLFGRRTRFIFSFRVGRTASAPGCGSQDNAATGTAEGAPPPWLHYPTSHHKFGRT